MSVLSTQKLLDEFVKYLINFPTTHLCDSRFSAISGLKYKYRNMLALQPDLHLKLPLLQPELQSLKAVKHQSSHETTHYNKSANTQSLHWTNNIYSTHWYKGTGKGHPITCNEGTVGWGEGGIWTQIYSLFNLRTRQGWVQNHIPATLLPDKKSHNHCTGDLVGLRNSLKCVENLTATGV